jgi:hypothetical protein
MKSYRSIRNFGIALSTIALLLVGSVAVAESVKPSATLTMKETEVGVLIGGDWAHGTLSYNGESHMFHMTGAKVGGVGITVAEVSGDVYHLRNAEDFYGTYFKAEAGITAAVGREGSWVKNSKGVTLHLRSDSNGVALSLGVEGLKISH